MTPTDLVICAILGVAMLRGLFLGLIREVCSLAALAGACVGVRFFVVPAGDWLARTFDEALGTIPARIVAGIVIAMAVIVLGAWIGRVLRRGARRAGLGWIDRASGGLLGAAEGALVAGILLAAVTAFAGRDHPLVKDSRSLAALEELQRIAQEERPAVAAPPPSDRDT